MGLAVKVEEMLKKEQSNAIAEQTLISFIEYVHLARLDQHRLPAHMNVLL